MINILLFFMIFLLIILIVTLNIVNNNIIKDLKKVFFLGLARKLIINKSKPDGSFKDGILMDLRINNIYTNINDYKI